jgi:hypothetical protein
MTSANAAHPVFEPILAELSEQHRDEVLAAFAAVEHSAHPSTRYFLISVRPVPRLLADRR